MDRICLSVAIVPIAAEQGWGEGIQGLVQSAFLWGYMATQLAGGALADRHGGRAVLAVAIAWFSLASLLLPAVMSATCVPAAWVLPLVLASRAAVGLGEGVALPSMNNLIATCIPRAKRATALGQVFSGFHSGNIVGLLLSPFIAANYGWRALFVCFGFLGAPLLALWLAAVPAAPRAAAAPASPAPASPVGKVVARPAVTVGALLRSRAVWAIIVVNFINHWGYFIYLNWMPSYFYKVLGLNLRASSLLSLLPWAVMAVGSSVAGVVADRLVQHGVAVTRVRKTIQSVAFLGPAAALLVLSNQAVLSPTLAVICLTTALGITSLGQAGFVANMSDVAPNHSGQLFGLCNTFGCLAGILGTSAVGFVVQATGSFNAVFIATAALYVIGVAVWNWGCEARQLFY